MNAYRFTSDADAYATAAALRVAAEQYDTDARTSEREMETLLGGAPKGQACRLAAQFRAQAELARSIADEIEEVTT